MTYAYDAAGELISASDPNASYTYAYDGVGRSVSSTEQIAGLADDRPYRPIQRGRISFRAFGHRRRHGRFRQRLRVRRRGRDDARSRKAAFPAATRSPTSWSHSPTTPTASSRRSPATPTWPAKTRSSPPHTPTTSRPPERFELHARHDDLGRLQLVLRPAKRGDAETSVDGTTNYTYDPTGQLLTATNTTTPSLDENYTYDSNGNRTSANGVTNTPTTGNQIASDGTYTYQYDNNGNLTAKVGVAGGSAAGTEIDYGWDYRNRLTSVTYKDNGSVTETIDYTYNAFNRLVGRVADVRWPAPQETVFVYDGENIALQFDGTGRARWERTTSPTAISGARRWIRSWPTSS